MKSKLAVIAMSKLFVVAVLASALATVFSGPASAAVPAGNLIVNPGAEDGPGDPGLGIVGSLPGWTRTGSFTVTQYGASGGFPGDGGDPCPSACPPNGGQNFFSGGPSAGASSTASQTIDLSGAASEIDAGGVSATFSGWLGGWSYDPDNMQVTADFLAADGTTAGRLTIGPVSAADRGNQTSFLFRAATGTVPAGTRSVKVTMLATGADGNGYNDGYADNLSLSLVGPPKHPTSTSVSCSPGSIAVAQPTTCTATVTDTAPSGQATPTGNVDFVSDSSGSFSSPSCSLSGGGSSTSCQVSYTASTVGSGAHAITANYAGDGTHDASSAGTGVTVTSDATAPTTTVSLSPASPSGSNGWYTGPIAVAVSAADPDDSVVQTRCVVDPAAAPTSFDQLPTNSCSLTGVSSDGQHTIYAASIDSAGNKEAPVSVSVKIDQTAPILTFGGDSTYTVDQTINVTCAASDPAPGSGLTSDPCTSPLASGPAYSFALGANAVSATATDRAGNSTTRSTTFTVKVTPSALGVLTKQFVQGSTKYQALPALLTSAIDRLTTAAIQQLDTLLTGLSPTQKAAAIDRYTRAVDLLATSGWLNSGQASVLKTLAAAL